MGGTSSKAGVVVSVDPFIHGNGNGEKKNPEKEIELNDEKDPDEEEDPNKIMVQIDPIKLEDSKKSRTRGV
jgi:hypothetical protein